MKKITQLGLIATIIFGMTSYSHAALLIEPLVGYNITSKFDAEANAILIEDISTHGKGGAFGGRLGYQNLGFQLGLDYLRSSIDLDDNDLKENLSLSEWAGFVGFEFPVFIRVYAGYIFAATGETETKTGDKWEFSKGSGMKLGLGFTGLPFIDINIEYRKGQFDELKVANDKTGATTDYSAIMIGLSVPFTL